MKIVVDTNIVFSALINTNSHIGDMLFNSSSDIEFYTCDLLKEEIERHHPKLQSLSRITPEKLKVSQDLLFSQLEFISYDLIIQDHWLQAVNLTSDVDADDIAFVALTLHLDAQLWTGDKRLIRGLAAKGFDRVVTTQDIIDLRDI